MDRRSGEDHPGPRPSLATFSATAEVIDRFRAALAARDIVPPERKRISFGGSAK